MATNRDGDGFPIVTFYNGVQGSRSYSVDCAGYPITPWYRHRAKRISTGLLVYWEWSAPDPTGANSGISPSDLSDIVLLGVRQPA